MAGDGQRWPEMARDSGSQHGMIEDTQERVRMAREGAEGQGRWG